MKLQHTFTINHTSELDTQTYAGVFTCKKRSIQDNARLGVRITQLNGGMHYDDDKPGYGVDSNTYSLNYMIAVLELGLVNKPDWFDLNNLVDMDLLTLVYKEVADFEAKFRRPARQETVSNTNSSTGSQESISEANGPSQTRAMVGNQVQAALLP